MCGLDNPSPPDFQLGSFLTVDRLTQFSYFGVHELDRLFGFRSSHFISLNQGLLDFTRDIPGRYLRNPKRRKRVEKVSVNKLSLPIDRF